MSRCVCWSAHGARRVARTCRVVGEIDEGLRCRQQGASSRRRHGRERAGVAADPLWLLGLTNARVCLQRKLDLANRLTSALAEENVSVRESLSGRIFLILRDSGAVGYRYREAGR
jgi:hypothetical protein